MMLDTSSTFNSLRSLQKRVFIKRLGEYIRQLLLEANTTKDNVPFSNMVSQEVITDINVLGARMLNRVVGNFYGTFIVTKKGNPI
jgi:hypothetical protein